MNLNLKFTHPVQMGLWKKRKYKIKLKGLLNIEENFELQVPEGKPNPLVGQSLEKITHYIQDNKSLKRILKA